MSLKRQTALFVMMSLMAWVVPTLADVRYVRCESGPFGRYRECRADTENRVELVRDLSGNRCRQWKSWGYDRNGVWVDRGCRAEFRVGRESGIGAGGAAAAGAILGGALVAAILAGRHDHTGESMAAPGWARGRFVGFSPKHGTHLDITIAPNGSVTGMANEDSIGGHFTSNDGLHLGVLEFDLERESWGFAATQKNDRDNVVYFRKK